MRWDVRYNEERQRWEVYDRRGVYNRYVVKTTALRIRTWLNNLEPLPDMKKSETMNDKKSMTCFEAGRKGGNSTLKRKGRAFFSEIGRRGVEVRRKQAEAAGTRTKIFKKRNW